MRLPTLILIIFFYSCTQKEYKEIVSNYETGEPEVIFYYQNEKDSTTYRKEVLFKNGKISQTGFFTNNLKDGEFVWYNENGKKSAKINYSNGIFIDTVFHWYENGKIKSKNLVLKGLPQSECEGCNGKIFNYDSTGFLTESYTLKNGNYEGEKMFYEKNGTWIKRTFKNNILNGETVEFIVKEKPNDTIIVKGQYINDLEEGIWIIYNLKKKSKEFIQYKKGKEDGERKIIDKNGVLRVHGYMKEGLMEGKVFHYDSLGKLKDVEIYKKDKLISRKKY
jgi:antitoxin component YwqK of YwqJK toxin-antitoxin module